jgi:hypothetical protein
VEQSAMQADGGRGSEGLWGRGGHGGAQMRYKAGNSYHCSMLVMALAGLLDLVEDLVPGRLAVADKNDRDLQDSALCALNAFVE